MMISLFRVIRFLGLAELFSEVVNINHRINTAAYVVHKHKLLVYVMPCCFDIRRRMGTVCCHHTRNTSNDAFGQDFQDAIA